MHLTLVPYIKAAGEIKTKPTQHSVKELRSIGLQPDILLCRSEVEVDEDSRRKISLFTNVEERAVVPLPDANSIYTIPRQLKEYGLDQIVVEKFNLDSPAPDLSEWDKVVELQASSSGEIRIAMVGKYMELLDAYKSLNEALEHAGIHNKTQVKIDYIDSETLEEGDLSALQGVHAILVPGGFGNRGIEGKIAAVRYARENNIPYLGICLGMQVAVIEFARDVANLKEAHSTEFNEKTPDPVIALITEWTTEDGSIERRGKDSDMGGTMRLGSQECHLAEGSTARSLYGNETIKERHRHRYEFNNNYLETLSKAGLLVSGLSADRSLVEIVEIPDHPWFVACQFHPEFTSTPRDGHPLFEGFVKAAMDYASREENSREIA